MTDFHIAGIRGECSVYAEEIARFHEPGNASCNPLGAGSVFPMPTRHNTRNIMGLTPAVTAKPDAYDLTSPLWTKYFRETRETVRFPRGYKEISLSTEGL